MQNNEGDYQETFQSGCDQENDPMRILSLKLKQRGFFDFQPSEIAEQNQENTQRIQEQQQMHEKTQTQRALEQKIDELQRMCQALTTANNNLLVRIDTLQNGREHQHRGSSEIDDKKSINSNYSQMEFQLHELQKIVTEYRNSFTKQKQKTSQQIFKKTVENDRLKEQMEKLRAQNYKLSKKCDESERYLQRQVNYCENLKLEIQNLKVKEHSKLASSEKLILNKSLSAERSFDSFSNKFQQINEDIDQNFSYTIFNQMQRMIKKLMNELEHQRKMKSKMNLQINRLIEEIRNYEIQIKERNDKIYYLQLDSIKKRSSTFSIVNKKDYSAVIDTTGNLTKEKQNSSVSQSRNQSMRMKDRSSYCKYPDQIDEINIKKLKQSDIKFIELMGTEPLISWNKKIWIGIKILNLYDKKIKEGKLKEIMLQDLIIKNLNCKNVGKMQVIDSSQNIFESVECSEQNLISNMCLIMENLLNEIPENDESSVSYIYEKDEISRFLQQCLSDKKQGKAINSINSLKKYFQEIAMNYLY